MTNIHERIYKELKKRRSVVTDPIIARRLDKELTYENNARQNPPKGVWVITDFGLRVDPVNDIGLKLPRRNNLKWQTRQKYENRGAEIINTKIPHILSSLYMHDGGAPTSEILDDCWFTTSMEFYGAMNNLTEKGRGRKRKVNKSNKTINYFKELLKWPKLEPIVELVYYQPDPKQFKTYTRNFEHLREIIKSAMRYALKVTFVPHASKSPPYYAIALPETASKGKAMQYDPERSQHFAILELTANGLSAKLRVDENDAIPVAAKALEDRINIYGQNYFKQKSEEAKAYRRRIGLDKA